MANPNDYFVPGLLALSGIIGNRRETSKQVNTQGSTQGAGVDSFRQNLLKQYQEMLGQTDQTSGMQASNLSDINNAYAVRKQQLMESLAARGITGFAADAALQQLDNQRFSDITKARQTGTFQAAQFRENLLGQAGNFASNSPATTTSTSSVTTPGRPFAQGFSNVADYLAHQYGQQYARNNPQVAAAGSPGSYAANNPQFGQGPNYIDGLKSLGGGLRKVFGKIFR